MAVSGIPSHALQQARALSDVDDRVRTAFQWRGEPDGLAVASAKLLGTAELIAALEGRG